MPKTEFEKPDRILIIGETEDETRRLANALVSDFSISAARNVPDAAGRLKKETFNVIIFDLRDEGSDPENTIQSPSAARPPDAYYFHRPIAGCSADC